MKTILIFLMVSLATAVFVACGASPGGGILGGGPQLPTNPKGVWCEQTTSPACIKFDDADGKAAAHLAFSATPDKFDKPETWAGPYPLTTVGDNAWSFEVKDVVRLDGDNKHITGAPSSTIFGQYIIDQNGRTLLRSGTRSEGDRSVKFSLSGDGKMSLEGLWERILVKRWDNNGKPTEFDKTPIKSEFVRKN